MKARFLKRCLMLTVVALAMNSQAQGLSAEELERAFQSGNEVEADDRPTVQKKSKKPNAKAKSSAKSAAPKKKATAKNATAKKAQPKKNNPKPAKKTASKTKPTKKIPVTKKSSATAKTKAKTKSSPEKSKAKKSAKSKVKPAKPLPETSNGALPETVEELEQVAPRAPVEDVLPSGPDVPMEPPPSLPVEDANSAGGFEVAPESPAGDVLPQGPPAPPLDVDEDAALGH